MGATLVKRHSSCCKVGKPNSAKWAMPAVRMARNHTGLEPETNFSKLSNSARYGSETFASFFRVGAVWIIRISLCSSGDGFGFGDPVIAFFFEFEREFLAAGFHDAAIPEDVHKIGHDVIEQALVM